MATVPMTIHQGPCPQRLQEGFLHLKVQFAVINWTLQTCRHNQRWKNYQRPVTTRFHLLLHFNLNEDKYCHSKYRAWCLPNLMSRLVICLNWTLLSPHTHAQHLVLSQVVSNIPVISLNPVNIRFSTKQTSGRYHEQYSIYMSSLVSEFGFPAISRRETQGIGSRTEDLRFTVISIQR